LSEDDVKALLAESETKQVVKPKLDLKDYRSDLNVVFEESREHDINSALPRQKEEIKVPETD
jgi:hypothetical protein